MLYWLSFLADGIKYSLTKSLILFPRDEGYQICTIY